MNSTIAPGLSRTHSSSSRSQHHRACLGGGLLLGLIVALLAPTTLSAQVVPGLAGGAAEVETVDPTTPNQIAARRAALAEELKALAAGHSPAPTEHQDEVRGRLRRLEGLLEEQAALAQHESPTVDPSPIEPNGDGSVYALNALYEAKWASEREENQHSDRLESAREALSKAKQKFDTAERTRREARSNVEKSPSNTRSELQRALQLRQLDSRLAQEEVHQLTLETRAAHSELKRSRSASDFDVAIRSIREDLAQGAGETTSSLQRLTIREGEVRRSREVASRRLATAKLRMDASASRLAKVADPSPELFEEVDALTAQRDAIQHEMALAETQLERLTGQRMIWQEWEELLRGKAVLEQTKGHELSATAHHAALKQAELQHQWRATDLQRRLDLLDGRLEEATENSQLRRAIEEQREALGRLQRSELAEVTALQAEGRLTDRYLDDLRGHFGGFSPLEFLARGADRVREVWTYEVTAVDDSPISVGSLVVALTMFSVGLWASRKGSAVVGRFSEDRLKLDAGAAHALQTLSFYLLLVSFGLLALRAVHFPLTAFTVVGGALAIGIGFGSQNVMNNFISGLILMLERPVRARDVVEVDGNHGTIEHIGARSTQIRSTDGRQIIVPNSFFLESNVVNWTLSDDLVRAKVTVGVIYGSPTRLVEQLIARAVKEEKLALSDPEPIIVFAEFGENSLNFDVYFWVRARSPMAMNKVQSHVRFAIDDLFREHELVIAFPQRDVHLDTVSPLEVRVLGADDPGRVDQ